MRSFYMYKSTEGLWSHNNYCTWNGVENDLHVFLFEIVQSAGYIP